MVNGVGKWVALSGLVAMAAAAQDSSLEGTVRSSKAAISDAKVTLRAEHSGREWVVRTSEEGTFLFEALTPDRYQLRVDKPSYKGARTEVTIRAGEEATLSLVLAPAVDPSNSVGVTVTPTFFDALPVLQPGPNGLRSYEQLANVAPEVGADLYGFGFAGAQSPENLYLLDGVSTNDPAYGLNRGQVPVEFLEKATVLTAGAPAEYRHGTGGLLSVTTRSGTNEFHGLVWGTLTPGALTGADREIRSDDSMIVQQSRPWNTGDFGALASGPILVDRLWFAAGFSMGLVSTQDTRSLRRFIINASGSDFVYDGDGYLRTTPIAGTTAHRFDDTHTISAYGKLTFRVADGHRLELSVIATPSSSAVPFSFSPTHVAGWNGGTTSHDDATTASLSYAGQLVQGLRVDATLGWFHDSRGTAPNDGSSLGTTPGMSGSGAPQVIFRRDTPHSILDFESIPDPSLCEPAGTGSSLATTPAAVGVRGQLRYLMVCPATGNGQTYTLGGLGALEASQLDRLQGRASVTWLVQALGHHAFKATFELQRDSFDVSRAWSGGEILRESTSGRTFSDYRQYGYYSDPDVPVTQLSVRSVTSSTLLGASLQDSWAIVDLLTLHAGLRYENQQLFTSGGALGLALSNELSPRVGLSYDFTRQGRSKVFVNYARAYETIPLALADRGLTGAQLLHASHANCNPLKDFNQVFDECRDPTQQTLFPATGGPTPVDSTIQGQSTDELLAGAQYELFPAAVLSATYTRRWLNHIVEDFSPDEGLTTVIGNPGSGLGAVLPAATRDYDAVTAAFSKAFDDGWQAQASYTWSSLRGNYDGLFRPLTGELAPNVSSDFDLLSLMTNRTGPLDANRTHAVKLFASKEFTFASGLGVLVGLSYDGHSGRPISYLGTHVLYGAGESFILPRGSGGELPWLQTVNAKVGVSYRFGPGLQAQLTLDVFNLLNFSAATVVDQNLTSTDAIPVTVASGSNGQQQVCIAGRSVAGCEGGVTGIKHADGSPLYTSELNWNFKRPTAYQAPISARVGVRLSF